MIFWLNLAIKAWLMCSLSYPLSAYRKFLGLSRSSSLAVLNQSSSFLIVPSIFFITISWPFAWMMSWNNTTHPPKTITATFGGFLCDLISTRCSVLSLSTAFRLSESLALASWTLRSTYLAIYKASYVWILASFYSLETTFSVYWASFFST